MQIVRFFGVPLVAGLVAAGVFAIWEYGSAGGSPGRFAVTAPPAPPEQAATPTARRSSGKGARQGIRPLPVSPPVLLEIPSIEVRTDLLRLGKNPDQTLEVPSLAQARRAGWYRLGPTPGSLGPAVIAGHVDTAIGPAVFWRLGELRPGDEVRVTRKDRRVAVFTIDAVERVAKDRFPTRKVYGKVSHAALRLITCGGAFDGSIGHYADNVIVYARLSSVR